MRDRAAVLQAVAGAHPIHGGAHHGPRPRGPSQDADKIIAALDGPVRAWDLSEPGEGQRLFALMRELLAGSPQVSSRMDNG